MVEIWLKRDREEVDHDGRRGGDELGGVNGANSNQDMLCEKRREFHGWVTWRRKGERHPKAMSKSLLRSGRDLF